MAKLIPSCTVGQSFYGDDGLYGQLRRCSHPLARAPVAQLDKTADVTVESLRVIAQRLPWRLKGCIRLWE